MTTKMYGTPNCPDVRAALDEIKKKKLDVKFINFDESVGNLKEFIVLRDNTPEFNEAKKNGTLGIPCFVSDDGRIFFDIAEI